MYKLFEKYLFTECDGLGSFEIRQAMDANASNHAEPIYCFYDDNTMRKADVIDARTVHEVYMASLDGMFAKVMKLEDDI